MSASNLEKARRRPKAKAILVGAALVFTAAGATFLALRPAGVVVATVARAELAPAIQGVGTVEAKVVIQLGAQHASGRIASIRVDQGDPVRRGDVLAELDASEPRAELERAKASLLVARAQHRDALAGTRPEELAEAEAITARAKAQLRDLAAGARVAELEELRERVRAARATRVLNVTTLSRRMALFAEGAIPIQELDAAQQAADVAKAQERGAEHALRLAEEGSRKEQVTAAAAQVQASNRRLAFLRAGTRPQQIAAAKARVAEAQAAVSLAEERLRDTVVTSPIDGYVVARLLEPGAVVNAGTPLLKLADERTAWVTVHVDERESAAIAVGQEASIALRSLRGATLRGRVARIQRESDRVTEQLAIDVAFIDRPARLTLGEQAEATLRPPPRPGALIVPAGAVVRRPEGAGVLVVDEGRLRFRKVAFGLADADGRIEVAGLEAGTPVALTPGPLADPSSEGRSVRILRATATP